MLMTIEHLGTWVRAHLGLDERGASLVEYALLLALIALVCILAVTTLGNATSTKFDSVANSVN